MILLVLLGCLGAAVAQEVATPPARDRCMCFTTSNVNIRDAPCGNVIGAGDQSVCSLSMGAASTCSLDGTLWTFWQTQMGWQASNFIAEAAESRCGGGGGGDCAGVPLNNRASWGARAPRSTTNLNLPLARVVLHHTVTAACTTSAACSAQMRSMQNFHMDGNGWADIGYNWCVGEDGAAYEGRGWTIQGAHAGAANSWSHGICVIGDYTNRLPNNAALDAVFNLISCGQNDGRLTSGWTIEGHRNVSATACPGNMLYYWLTSHPRYRH